jgi:hypothetical protein
MKEGFSSTPWVNMIVFQSEKASYTFLCLVPALDVTVSYDLLTSVHVHSLVSCSAESSGFVYHIVYSIKKANELGPR